MIINFFSDFCFPGGIPVHQGELAERLTVTFGHRVRICVPWPLLYDMDEHRRFIETADKENRLEDIYYGLKYLVKITDNTKLSEIICSADINHFHGSFSTNRAFLGTAIQLSRIKRRNFYTFHSESVNPKCMSDLDELKRRISNIQTVCTVSENVNKSLLKIFPDISPIITENGYIVSCNKKIETPNKSFTVLYIGRLNKTKGIDHVLRLAKDIINTGIKLYIVGSAEFDKVYDALVTKVADNKNVFWISRSLSRKEIMELYDLADVLYLPSQMEGRSQVVLDAIANNCVPVVSRVGNLENIITSYKNGFIFDYDDYQSHLDAIMYLFNNRECLYKMKAELQNTKLASWDDTAELLNKLYSKVCDE